MLPEMPLKLAEKPTETRSQYLSPKGEKRRVGCDLELQLANFLAPSKAPKWCVMAQVKTSGSWLP